MNEISWDKAPVYWSDYIGISIRNGVVSMHFEAMGKGQCSVVVPIEEFMLLIKNMNSEGWRKQFPQASLDKEQYKNPELLEPQPEGGRG